LRDGRAQVVDYIATHRAVLEEQGIHPGGYSLPLRPAFVDAGQLRRAKRAVDAFWGALLKVYFVEFGGDLRRIAAMLQLDEPVVEVIERYFTPERTVAQLIGRSDGFSWGGGWKFIEQNITSGPGGLPRTHALARFFDGFPPMRAVREGAEVAPMSPVDAYVSLFSSPGYRGRTIGYVDALGQGGDRWDDEGLQFLAMLAREGVTLIDLTGRELALRDDGVYADGRRLDAVYRGVAGRGLWFRIDELLPLYQACGRGQLTMLMSPYEMVFFDKMLLPYLSDASLGLPLDAAERRLLDRIVPWTRFLRDEVVEFRGHRAPTPDICVEHRTELVLKKGNGFASSEVVIGAETDEPEWKGQVEHGLGERNWVVQELVQPPTVRLPFLDGDDIVWADVISMSCPFVLLGQITGIAIRTSVPGGGRILVGAGLRDSAAGARTAFRLS
jgi:hypothetical protein